MPLTVAWECLNGCSGCEVGFLDLGERLLALLPELDIVHFPLLMDHKHYGQTGEKKGLEIPQSNVGIVSGGIGNEEHLEVAQEMRKQCGILIALGTCATHGGIPALANQFGAADLVDKCYGTSETTDGAPTPTEAVPSLLDRTYALDEKIRVDLYLPGCPPHSDHIAAVIEALLKGEQPVLPTRSVCDTCPTRREGKGGVKQLRRFTQNARFDPNKPLSEMLCLLKQGFPCMGPVTRAGCSGAHAGTPACITARTPCSGCFGPVRQNGNQLLDMLNALISNGINIPSIPDRTSFLAFSGAHQRIRKKR